MNKRILFLTTTILTGLICISRFSFAFSRYKKSPDNIVISISKPADITHSVKFYKLYNGSTWYQEETINVKDGEKLTCPSLSKDGYTLNGWSINVPSMEHYVPTYTVEQLNNMPITQDMTFYPILESNKNKVWINALGIVGDENSDITISVSTIGTTKIGKSYVGINQIPNVIADWSSNRELFTSSGIYKFNASNGAATINRKIGFKPNAGWAQNWGSGTPAFFIHSWGKTDESILLGNSLDGNGVVYGYMNATNKEFQLVRNDHNNKSIDWNSKNQSGNLSFDSSWWWGGSGSNHYSSSTIILNKWDGSNIPFDGWGPDHANWIS